MSLFISPMEILLLTPDHLKVKEAETINQLFSLGLKCLHIRKPGFTLQEYRNYLASIDSKYFSRLVMHGGGFELYHEFGLGGIHLNSHQRTDGDVARQIANIPMDKVSTSFHSWAEISHDKNDYNYVFVSPVFDSISKTNYHAAIDLRGLAGIRKRFAEKNRKCPRIYALGGVDSPHIHILQQYHFDGAAVYGAIWKSSNPTFVLQGLLQLAKDK